MRNIWFVLLCLMGFLLVGCQPHGAASPEEAAAGYIISRAQGLLVDPQTVQIAQKQNIDIYTFVVVAYQRQLSDGGKESCKAVVYTYREGITRWMSRGDTTICINPQALPGQVVEPMAVMGSTLHGLDGKRPDLSFVLGMVHQPEIVQASVRWADGQLYNAAVVNGTFLAVREGEVTVDWTVGLDAAGATVFTVQQ